MTMTSFCDIEACI